MVKPKYIHWIEEENVLIDNYDGEFKCYRLNYNHDDDVLNDWAHHIRNHYISDEELEQTIFEFGIPKEKYLKENVLPQKTQKLGSISRSNTMTELLISDLLEYIFGYHVPRVRQEILSDPTEFVRGTDVFGFKYINNDFKPDKNDTLIACEVKGVLSSEDTTVIEKAITDSKLDLDRLSKTLDFTRRKLKSFQKYDEANKVARFQFKTKDDYIIKYAAAGITNVNKFDERKVDDKIIKIIPGIDGAKYVIPADKSIYFIYGKDLMQLTHDLYERCLK